MPTPVRMARLNVENLFRRASALNQPTWAKPPSRFLLIALLSCLVGCLLGCGKAAFDSRSYYLAQDPETGVTNYFRVDIEGSSQSSEIKFSVGFYDRDAIETLFGETALQQEYLGSKVKMFDDDTGKRLHDISENLSLAKRGRLGARKEHLVLAASSVAEMIGRYETRLAATPDQLAIFTKSLERAKTALAAARTSLTAVSGNDSLDDSAKLLEASVNIREAQAILEGIRIAVDGNALVRFFDGAGNEIDVSGRCELIFVASDISRFAEAIRQLAESNEATQDVIRVIMGAKIQESEMARRQLATSTRDETALAGALQEYLKNSGSLTDVIKNLANVTAGGSTSFKSSAEIRGYVQARFGK